MPQTQLGRPVGASGEETRQRIIAATMRCCCPGWLFADNDP